MADIVEITTTANEGITRWAKPGDVPQYETVEIEAESVKLRIGTLEIETGLLARGKFLADSKPLPGLRSLCLRFDYADPEEGGTGGVWKIHAEMVPLKP